MEVLRRHQAGVPEGREPDQQAPAQVEVELQTVVWAALARAAGLARALSIDIGRAIEVADEVRKI